MDSCKYCNEPVSGNFCPNCGQPVKLKKIDRRYVIHEITDVFNVNNKMFFTVKSLLTNPGESVKHYIAENRSPFVRPVSFVFINSLIYTLVHYLFPIEIEGIIPQVEIGDIERLIFKWIQENSGYVTLLIGFFMAFGTKIFFRKSGYNLYESFMLLSFVFGVTLLFDSIFVILQKITGLNLTQVFTIVETIYITWAVGQYFDGKKAVNYIKALLSYLFGLLMILIVSVIISFIIFTVIDFINKQ